MMLPSGNDAAQSLAIYFGNFNQIMTLKPSTKPQRLDANLDVEKYFDSEDENETNDNLPSTSEAVGKEEEEKVQPTPEFNELQ